MTARGPNGKLKVLHNNVGGHVTLTSSSGRLFSCLSVKNPLLKLLLSCVQGHIQSYTDAGLFAAGLALSLTLNSLDLDLHPRLIAEVYEHLLSESLSILKSPQGLPMCLFKFNSNN